MHLVLYLLLGYSDVPAIERVVRVVQLQRLLAEIENAEAGKHLIGLTRPQVIRELGVPADPKAEVWIYPGSRWERVVTFKDGKVVSASWDIIDVGCRRLEPVERLPLFVGR